MPKRLRQASLIETTLAKKKCDQSLPGTSTDCLLSNPEKVMELVTESEENSLKSAKDPLDTEVLVSQHECESLCCTNDKPFQPLDKSSLIKLAKKNRNFMTSWYKTYPWLTVCMERKKVFC